MITKTNIVRGGIRHRELAVETSHAHSYTGIESRKSSFRKDRAPSAKLEETSVKDGGHVVKGVPEPFHNPWEFRVPVFSDYFVIALHFLDVQFGPAAEEELQLVLVKVEEEVFRYYLGEAGTEGEQFSGDLPGEVVAGKGVQVELSVFTGYLDVLSVLNYRH